MAISLRQLRYFAKVVETGNITRASEQLHLAQTALGLQIRQMEETLRAKLLVRHSRGTDPTEAGALLYERATEILRLVDETTREVKALGSVQKPTITMGVTPSILKLVGDELDQVMRLHLPGVDLHIVEELSYVLIEALERQELDYVLGYQVPERPGLKRVALMDEELLFVAGPSDPSEVTIAFKTALDTPLALVSRDDVVSQLVHAAATKLSLPVKVAFEVKSVDVIKTLVLRGAATSIMPYGIVAEELKTGALVGKRVEQPALIRTLYFVRHNRASTFATEATFVSVIGQVVESLSAKIGPLAQPLNQLDDAPMLRGKATRG